MFVEDTNYAHYISIYAKLFSKFCNFSLPNPYASCIISFTKYPSYKYFSGKPFDYSTHSYTQR